MSSAPGSDDPDRDADQQKQAMHAQLRKDVASWSAARSDETTRGAEEFRVPVAQPAARRATRAKPAAQPVVADVKPVAVTKKPFSMSYDGVTTREHIAYRISRGAR
jgi:hypothetical protein